MKYVIVFLLSSLCLACAVEHPSKPNQSVKIPSNERKFKSGKVQQVWEKAERFQLSSVRLADLYVDLKHHDHRVMELKTLQSQNKDEDGILDNKLKIDLQNIMIKYGLAGNNNDLYSAQDEKHEKKVKRIFDDLKLNKFWKDVVASGKFSDHELEGLLVEFKHHEDKMNEVKEIEELQRKYKDSNENSVEKQKYEERFANKEYLENLAKELEESYQKLHLVTRKSKGEKLPFTDPKVLDLYYKMKEGNFSELEEQSIIEELRHYEVRIDKHRHFREELKNIADKIDFHGGKEHAPPTHLDKHQRLQDKVRDMADKMQKAFVGLKSRLGGGVIEFKEEL